MKSLVAASIALVFTCTAAAAGGFNGGGGSLPPQFANASALNYALQATKVQSIGGKVKIDQTAGASAKAVNKADCNCRGGLQVANAVSKNVSIQVGSVQSIGNGVTFNQTAVSTATARNVRGH